MSPAAACCDSASNAPGPLEGCPVEGELVAGPVLGPPAVPVVELAPVLLDPQPEAITTTTASSAVGNVAWRFMTAWCSGRPEDRLTGGRTFGRAFRPCSCGIRDAARVGSPGRELRRRGP